MSDSYAPLTPRDKGGQYKSGYAPAKVSLQSTNKENASVSSILLLTHDTTEVEVMAVGQGVVAKWLSQATVDSSVAGTSVITAAGSANFDFTVSANTLRRFVVPIATVNQAQQSVQGVNRLLGLYPAIALKTIVGTGSILTGEY